MSVPIATHACAEVSSFHVSKQNLVLIPSEFDPHKQGTCNNQFPKLTRSPSVNPAKHRKKLCVIQLHAYRNISQQTFVSMENGTNPRHVSVDRNSVKWSLSNHLGYLGRTFSLHLPHQLKFLMTVNMGESPLRQRDSLYSLFWFLRLLPDY